MKLKLSVNDISTHNSSTASNERKRAIEPNDVLTILAQFVKCLHTQLTNALKLYDIIVNVWGILKKNVSLTGYRYAKREDLAGIW